MRHWHDGSGLRQKVETKGDKAKTDDITYRVHIIAPNSKDALAGTGGSSSITQRTFYTCERSAFSERLSENWSSARIIGGRAVKK